MMGLCSIKGWGVGYSATRSQDAAITIGNMQDWRGSQEVLTQTELWRLI